MELSKRIEQDWLAAYKAKDELKVAVLRMLKTAAKYRQVELGRPLDDSDYLDLTAKQIKQRREAAEQFAAAGRAELAAKEENEITVLKDYLPQALTQDELEAAVREAVSETGAAGVKDMGRVVQYVLTKYKGRADGKSVSGLARSVLTSA